MFLNIYLTRSEFKEQKPPVWLTLLKCMSHLFVSLCEIRVGSLCGVGALCPEKIRCAMDRCLDSTVTCGIQLQQAIVMVGPTCGVP